MSETRILNAEVSAHGNTDYGTGYEQGVAFRGIEGFWQLSPKTRDEMAEKDAMWPPEKGRVVRVELELRPNPNKEGKFYYNILRYFPKSSGDAETWQHAGTRNRAETSARNGAQERDLSIGRQVVVKAEARVLVALLAVPGAGEDTNLISALYDQWRAHCRQLWGSVETKVLDPPALKPETTESEVMGDPGLDGGDEGPIPF